MFFTNFELFSKMLMLVPITAHPVHSISPPSLQSCQLELVVLSRPYKEDTRAISICVPELPHLSWLFMSRCKLTPKHGLLHCFPQSGDHVPEKMQAVAPIAWGHWMVDDWLELSVPWCAQEVLSLSLVSSLEKCFGNSNIWACVPTSHSRYAPRDPHSYFLPSL